MTENPYSSPTIEQPPVSTDLPPMARIEIASQGARFVNFLIDGVIVRVIATGAGVLLAFGWMAAAGPSEDPFADSEPLFTIVSYALGFGITISYYAITEALFQRTLAKFITGTKVVTPTGGQPTLGQIVGRSFARLIPFEAFSFLTTNPVGWHDSLSKTRVVRAR